jgi:hypothetical protein
VSGYGDKRQRTTSLTADQDETFADRDQGRHAPGQTKALISNVALVAADATTRAARTLQFAASLGKPPPGRSFIAYPEPALSAGTWGSRYILIYIEDILIVCCRSQAISATALHTRRALLVYIV